MKIVAKIGSTVVLGLLFFSSCATVNPTQNHYALSSWVDHYYVDVIHQIGEPDYVFEDQVNGRVLVYSDILNEVTYSDLNKYTESFEDEAYDMVWVNSINRTVPTRVERESDLLYVNKDGIVYSFQSNKSDKIVREEYENEVVIIGVISTFALLGLLLLGS